MSCLTSASHTMLADILDLRSEIDPDTNETLRNWVKTGETRCRVYAYFGGGSRGTGAVEDFGKEYENVNDLRVKSPISLSKRQRITNIRDARTGRLLWAEDENLGEPTVFNISGFDPVVHPMTGRVTEYIGTITRAEVS